jgi:Helix-turn-helix domain
MEAVVEELTPLGVVKQPKVLGAWSVLHERGPSEMYFRTRCRVQASQCEQGPDRRVRRRAGTCHKRSCRARGSMSCYASTNRRSKQATYRAVCGKRATLLANVDRADRKPRCEAELTKRYDVKRPGIRARGGMIGMAQAADNLRHDGSLTATARLVGLEIFSFVNEVSGSAWPAEETIADRLAITARTVRTAIKQLKAAGYISVVRRGRSNMYFPVFIDLIGENFSGIEGGSSDTSPEKNGADTGKKQHAISEKNDPLTLLSNPIRTPSSKAAAEERKITQRNKREDRQKAENEIADILGWSV